MKFFISILLTALVTYTAGLYFPWWSLAVAAFIVAVLLHQSPLKAFLSGFLGVFLLWFVLSLIIASANDYILSHRIAEIFPLGGSSILLIIISALVGGLVGGAAALTGSYLRFMTAGR